MVYCTYSQHETLSTFSLISLFAYNMQPIRHDIAHICAKSAVKPQLIHQSALEISRTLFNSNNYKAKLTVFYCI